MRENFSHSPLLDAALTESLSRYIQYIYSFPEQFKTFNIHVKRENHMYQKNLIYWYRMHNELCLWFVVRITINCNTIGWIILCEILFVVVCFWDHCVWLLEIDKKLLIDTKSCELCGCVACASTPRRLSTEWERERERKSQCCSRNWVCAVHSIQRFYYRVCDSRANVGCEMHVLLVRFLLWKQI